MANRISRPLEYHGRHAQQQADQAIRGNVERALVELITNSDDSLRKLEARGQKPDGRISIEIQPKRMDSHCVIVVEDLAEGMDVSVMDRAVGVYADETSGFLTGEPVRGYFGRGLKDSILALGEGNVTSVVDGTVCVAWLGYIGQQPYYERSNPSPSKKSNSTRVEIITTRPNIVNPQFATLRSNLGQHFALREILANPNRTVSLRYLRRDGKTSNQANLTYQQPKGELLLTEELTFRDFPARCELRIFRAVEPLQTPVEIGPYAPAGILVRGEAAAYDNVLVKFDRDPNARRFFGIATCTYLDDLVRSGDTIVSATRDGLVSSHPFVSALFTRIEELLEPFVISEARRVREEQRSERSQELKRKLSRATTALNEIATKTLSAIDLGGPIDSPSVPEEGYGFVPDILNVAVTKPRTITFRALENLLPEFSEVSISSDNRSVSVLTPSVVLKANRNHEWLVEGRIRIEGNQVGVDAMLEAESQGLQCEALVHVIGRPDPPGTAGESGKRGLFNDIQFSQERDPGQRVRYDPDTRDIFIFVSHPSVRPYIANSAGAGTDTAQGQVILAELVSEAVCVTIARQGVEKGHPNFPTIGDSQDVSIQSHQLRLHNQYAASIHEALVDSDFRFS